MNPHTKNGALHVLPIALIVTAPVTTVLALTNEGGSADIIGSLAKDILEALEHGLSLVVGIDGVHVVHHFLVG